MLTHAKLKKPEPSVEFRRAYIKYSKILLVINSCLTGDHIIACGRMINNFEAWCIKYKVSTNSRLMLMSSLEKVLNIKIQEVRKT
jgi:hypothetical protein